MRYFLLKTDPQYDTAPVIENWYPTIDVRLIHKETGHKLPERELLFIRPNPNTVFTDVVDFPFFLGTKMVRDVIKMYEPATMFREIILLDRQNAKSEVYYLPLLEHCDCLTAESELSRGRDTLITAVLDSRKIEDTRANRMLRTREAADGLLGGCVSPRNDVSGHYSPILTASALRWEKTRLAAAP